MSSKRSIAGILGDLESEIVRLEKEEAHYAQQEAAFRGKRAACAERLALVRERYEAFRSASAGVGEVVPESAISEEEDGGQSTVVRRILRAVAGKGEDERFTPSELAAELSRTRPVDSRTVSQALRRLVARKEIRVVQEGKPYHEAVYSRKVR